MKSKYYISCPHCLEKIARTSTRAARLWMDLCALKLSLGDVIQLESTSREVEILEKLGYIVTTERNKSKLLLKLKGNFYERKSQDVFCLKNCPDD